MSLYTVKKFTFDTEAKTISLIVFVNTAEGGDINNIAKVDFTLPNLDVKKYDNTLPPAENDIVRSEVSPDTWLFSYEGDSDEIGLGIYSGKITYSGTPEESGTVTLVIGDYSEVTRCLITKTINEVYDCLLIQQLEAIRQAIFSSDEDLARDVYDSAKNKCASCKGEAYTGTITGSKIIIEDGLFISV